MDIKIQISYIRDLLITMPKGSANREILSSILNNLKEIQVNQKLQNKKIRNVYAK